MSVANDIVGALIDTQGWFVDNVTSANTHVGVMANLQNTLLDCYNSPDAEILDKLREFNKGLGLPGY